MADILINSNIDEELAQLIFDGSAPRILIVSYSTSGEYKYTSITSWSTLESLNDKAISYDEWVDEADAGF